jgi:hypothetical protein
LAGFSLGYSTDLEGTVVQYGFRLAMTPHGPAGYEEQIEAADDDAAMQMAEGAIGASPLNIVWKVATLVSRDNEVIWLQRQGGP